ncbi:MAG: guanylate kinase [Cyanobacteria bacterium SIG26]|nr:guanylate kinase [Cyanobacteria bacterium SIG26]
MDKKLFVISGCSGVGKGTVLKEFMARNSQDFILSVSCTTRAPREGEVDGVNYFFLTKEQFLKNIEEDKFLEHAQFAGNHYGTKKKYIRQKFEEGYNIILEIETQGALQVKEKMPEAVLIFIAPPGVDTETGDISGGVIELDKRLRGRHTEDDETIKRRLAEAKVELERSKKYDYVVINDDLERAISEVESITQKELSKNA